MIGILFYSKGKVFYKILISNIDLQKEFVLKNGLKHMMLHILKYFLELSNLIFLVKHFNEQSHKKCYYKNIQVINIGNNKCCKLETSHLK